MFFDALKAAGDERTFHPHALDLEGARQVCAAGGDDLYYVLAAGDHILAYGLLRGWDEGYEMPSLGIAVHPEARGRGFGRLLMEFLHASARERGAPRVRLRVHPGNRAARALYDSLGYRFSGEDRGELVGWFEL